MGLREKGDWGTYVKNAASENRSGVRGAALLLCTCVICPQEDGGSTRKRIFPPLPKIQLCVGPHWGPTLLSRCEKCKSQQPSSRTAFVITVTTQPGMLPQYPLWHCIWLSPSGDQLLRERFLPLRERCPRFFVLSHHTSHHITHHTTHHISTKKSSCVKLNGMCEEILLLPLTTTKGDWGNEAEQGASLALCATAETHGNHISLLR